MAVSLFANEVSDICLGKPALRSLSVSTATVADALSALKRSGGISLSVWSCNHGFSAVGIDECVCVGKICVADIVCFLSREENLLDPAAALQAPLSAVLPKAPGLVRHLEPNSRLVDAIDLMLEGAQNLVISLEIATTYTRNKQLQKSSSNPTLHDNNREYCWLTQEDIIRYLLTSISRFSPTPSNPISVLQVIDTDNILAVHYDDSASSALPLIALSILTQTSVAVVDHDGKLVGEISPLTLNLCDEAVSLAIATLSVGDLMAYLDCCGPPDELVQLVKERLQERNLGLALELMEEDCGIWSSSCSSHSSASSDEEFGLGRSGRSGGYSPSSRLSRSSAMAVCQPWSSLVAVMIQALSRRVSYLWVVEEDGSLVGIVTFTGMLKVFRERLRSIS